MDGVLAFLRRAHPSATALNVQAATGISAATVENWLRGRAQPSAAHLGVLVSVYGAGFMAHAFPPAAPWLAREAAANDLAAAVEQLQSAAARAARLV